eukprot:TRINITY_DN10140_c0_g1_i1.p1 TRINITY_DN10140_c0_g1~~TRINITY_DN10140_c0_g1_i1.p1  ORF type:complete len:195 (+),score=33.34 TRINITY_DN10140_c0_g1_i1:3-587(+)
MYKIVVVGDAACGKTTLLLSATRGAFPEVIDTTSMQYSSKAKVGGKNAEFELYDTYGTDESQRQRVALYPGTDVFVICYSIISPYSFDNVRTKWLPEVSRYCDEKAKIVLVGTKRDMRNDEDALDRLSKRKLAPISFQQGVEMKKAVSAAAYVECSSKDATSLNEVFEEISSILGPQTTKKNSTKRANTKCTVF